MTVKAELRFLREGPRQGEKPGALGTVRFIARCPGNAHEVLRKTKEVLEVVLAHDKDDWPPDADWGTLLPEWFVSACAKEQSQEEAEASLKRWQSLPREEQGREEDERCWTVDGWMYWMHPDNRQWYWWDAMVPDTDTVIIAVTVPSWPFPWKDLGWLFRAAGAISLQPEE